MVTNAEFYLRVRAVFPALAHKADRLHVKYWGQAPSPEESAYTWFESVANAVNDEMRQGTWLSESQAFFEFVEDIFAHQGSSEVKNCIDVALVENLFWQVPPQKIAPYWQVLPTVLKNLYIGFHSRAPV